MKFIAVLVINCLLNFLENSQDKSFCRKKMKRNFCLDLINNNMLKNFRMLGFLISNRLGNVIESGQNLKKMKSFKKKRIFPTFIFLIMNEI